MYDRKTLPYYCYYVYVCVCVCGCVCVCVCMCERCVCLVRGHYTESLVYFSSLISSSLYHACNQDIYTGNRAPSQVVGLNI